MMGNNNVFKAPLEIICKKCGEKIEASWTYCPNCTNKIDHTRCDKCGNILFEDWKYCPLCKNEKVIAKRNDNISLNGNDWIKEMLGK